LTNELAATPCIYEQCPNASVLKVFSNYASGSVQSVTGESNNLYSFYDFAYHAPIFSCPTMEQYRLDYSTGPFFFKSFDGIFGG
jgi:hypothetical protein